MSIDHVQVRASCSNALGYENDRPIGLVSDLRLLSVLLAYNALTATTSQTYRWILNPLWLLIGGAFHSSL